MAGYKCNCCDYLRCVKSIEECSAGVTRKADIHKNLREATVCVKPESPRYGEHIRKNTAACKQYADWFYKLDFSGESDGVRAEQARLIAKYRCERLGMDAPLEVNGGAGFAPSWF